jgi:RimJ/RimL family protein N-acetyltransferase
LETYDYKKLNFRMISWLDYKQFEDACKTSQKELTEFLSIGEFMSQYISMDYWNLFGALLKSQEMDMYGLYGENKLLGVASISKSSRHFGCQIVYWIRNGFHGMGLGRYFMFRLLTEALGRKNFLFAELIIDDENIASIKVAEQLGLELVHEWEGEKSGQGTKNSGKFRMYYAFENIFRLEAEKNDLTPIELLAFFWQQMDEAGIDMRQFLPRPWRPQQRTTLANNLRLVVHPNEPETDEPNDRSTDDKPRGEHPCDEEGS